MSRTTVYEITPPPPPRQQLVAVPINDIDTAALPPPRFVVDTIIPRRMVTLLSGHGGSGKSFLALTLCAHVAAGRGWGPFSCVMGAAVYFSFEDESEIVRYRLKKVIATYELDPEAVAANLRIFDATEAEPLAIEVNTAGVRHLARTATHAELEQAAAGACLVAIDNASDCFAANENDRTQVRDFVRGLAGIGRANDAGVLLAAHIDKNAARHGGNGQTFSGSTGWHNSSRSRLAIVEQDGRLTLQQEKSNHGPEAKPVPLRWTDTGALVPAGGDAVFILDPTADADDAGLLAAIQAATDAEVIVPAARSGCATALSVLRTFDELPAAFTGRGGKERFWRSMARLQRGSSITLETYRDTHRHEKKRYILAPFQGCGSAAVPLVPPRTAAPLGGGAAVCASSGTAAELPQPAQCSAQQYRDAREGL